MPWSEGGDPGPPFGSQARGRDPAFSLAFQPLLASLTPGESEIHIFVVVFGILILLIFFCGAFWLCCHPR